MLESQALNSPWKCASPGAVGTLLVRNGTSDPQEQTCSERSSWRPLRRPFPQKFAGPII